MPHLFGLWQARDVRRCTEVARAEEIKWSVLPQEEAQRAADDEERVRRGFWKKLKTTAARIPFAEEVTAAYFAAFDRNTPLKVRATLLAALAYFILPFDFAPDFLPIIGFSDDMALLMGALKLLSNHVTPEHYKAAREALDDLRKGGR